MKTNRLHLLQTCTAWPSTRLVTWLLAFFCEATERAIKVYNKKKSPNGFGFNRLSAAATSDFLKNAAVNILKPVTGFNVYE
uniref:Secreted protein n=1 Tax=Meloidogyne incognita TaxID=6306 RepID=A0A914P2B8_MELIC